jgi:hypothetical protein
MMNHSPAMKPIMAGLAIIRYTEVNVSKDHTQMIKLPLGIHTFSKVIEQQNLYIDKTAMIYDLLQQGTVYFLSRPRRFGKSMLISTLEALFLGKKELFENLAIAKTDYDFTPYPVIKLEFTKIMVQKQQDLIRYLLTNINRIAKQHEISLDAQGFDLMFDELVSKLHQKYGEKVVILIDEYDKPILSNLHSPMLGEVKEVMNAFYAVIKSLDEHLRFVFITGVSKFAKVSVFSGMNNLTDISMSRDCATLCGITEEELQNNFKPLFEPLAKELGQTKTQMLKEIKRWYNGYYFHRNAPGVYNPYSVLSLFRHREFNNYWFETGTPTFLLDLLQQKQYDFESFTQCEVGASAFAASEPENINLPSLFFQTGYLTIKGFNHPLYTLDFPNDEVKKSFYDSVATQYSQITPGMGETYTTKLTQHLIAGRLDDFFTTLAEFFANIPNNITLKDEKYYQSIFYAVITLIGFDIVAEVNTNQGRIDCVLQTGDTIYIIEFKLNDTKEAALQQIKDKQYSQKYQSSSKKIVLLGVEFDPQKRNIGGYLQG